MNNVEKFFLYLLTCFQGYGCVKLVLKLNASLVIRRRLLQKLQTSLNNICWLFFLILLSVCFFCTVSLQWFKSYQEYLKNILNYFWILLGLFLYSGIKKSTEEHLRCIQGPKPVPYDRCTLLSTLIQEVLRFPPVCKGHNTDGYGRGQVYCGDRYLYQLIP